MAGLNKNSHIDDDEDEDTLLNEIEDDVDSDEDIDEEGDEGSEESTGEESSDEAGTEADGTEESGEETSASEDGEEQKDEREAIRERRRQERKLRKQRIHEREERFRSELAARDSVIAEMQQQLGVINRKNFSSELVQLDGAINQAAQAYEYYKNQLADGAKAGDGVIVADATEKMFQARQAAEHYVNIKKTILANQNKPPSINPVIQNFAKEWHDKNKWYDPSGKNIDSRITMAIDDSLVSEGFDPSTKVYWDELSNRVKKYIPHRAQMVYNDNKDDANDRRSNSNGESKPKPKPKSVVTGSGKESVAGKGEIHISADRKKAMQEAGLWDDPVARNKALKQYKEYDRAHGKS